MPSSATSIDWPTTFTAAKDVVLAIAAIVTASVAVAGLRRWRLELEGKANFEAARSLARSTYKMREAFRVVRNSVEHERQVKRLNDAISQLRAKVYRLERRAGIDPFSDPNDET